MKKVAITGGLSCGKSTVAQIFQKKGAYFVSADAIVHQLFSASSPIRQQLTDLLGKEAISNEEFDRRIIAKKIFNDTTTLKKLEALLHPAVLEEIEKQYKQVQRQNYTVFIAEIPLLYEIEKADQFDAVIAVVADPKVAKKRFMKKTNYSEEEFEKRMIHQLPPSKKSALANYTIENNGNLQDLEKKCTKIYQQLTQD